MATAIQEENIILYVIVRLKSVQEYMFQYKIMCYMWDNMKALTTCHLFSLKQD